jgi:acyl-coenzyme A thioesterase PaaI-like protein
MVPATPSNAYPTPPDAQPYPVELARLVAATRDLVVAVGLTEASDDELRRATAAVTGLTAELRKAQRVRVLRMPEPTPSTTHTGEPVSGTLNPFSPPVLTHLENDGSLTATVHLSRIMEGPIDSVHGGYLAMMFDSVMGQLIHGNGIRAVTGTLSVRFRERTPIDSDLTMTARIVERAGRKIMATGTVSAAGTVTASAEGIFVTVDR